MEVLNKYKDPVPENAVYIGRGSPYGNPFVIGKDGTREEVIAKHRQFLIDLIVKRNPKILKALDALKDDDVLVCFCKPAPCHGDTIIEIRNELKEGLDKFIMKHTPLHPSKDGIEHINVYSKGKTQLGRDLSNFAHTPFTHPTYGRFECLEGFWYYVSTGKTTESLKMALGPIAKKIGKTLKKVHNPKFEQEICTAVDLKLQQNPEILKALQANTLPLVHYYWYGTETNCKIVEPEGDKWLIEYIKTYSGNKT